MRALVPRSNKITVMKNETKLILYDKDNRKLSTIAYANHETNNEQNYRCFYCGSLIHTFTNDENYFRLLESLESNNISKDSFNQGYYDRFFREVQKLGRGHSGSVYLTTHVIDGCLLGTYAVKKIPVGANKQWLSRMLKEVKILEKLRHNNIIEYKHSWIENFQPTRFGPEVPCLFVLMELANGGNLEEYILQSQLHISFKDLWFIFLDICKGLAHLHSHNIIHRDLKPSNLLLKFSSESSLPTVLISDFGECEDLLSNYEISRRTGATGTLEFTAPELLKTDLNGDFFVEYSRSADLWSLGMVLYFLCFRNLPYTSADDIDLLKDEILKLKRFHFIESSALPLEIRNVLTSLLSKNPHDRISCETILSNYAGLIFVSEPVIERQRLLSDLYTPNEVQPGSKSKPKTTIFALLLRRPLFILITFVLYIIVIYFVHLKAVGLSLCLIHFASLLYELNTKRNEEEQRANFEKNRVQELPSDIN